MEQACLQVGGRLIAWQGVGIAGAVDGVRAQCVARHPQRQFRRPVQGDAVFRAQGPQRILVPGVARALGIEFLVLVGLVGGHETQAVGGQAERFEFQRAAIRAVVVDAAPAADAALAAGFQGRVAAVGERGDFIVVAVVVQTQFQAFGVAQARLRDEIHAFLVPIRPLPVARAHGIGRRRLALFAMLLVVAERIFVARPRAARRQAHLEREFMVLAVSVVARAAIFRGGGAEIGRQGKAVAVDVRHARLQIPQALVRAHVGRRLALAARAEADGSVAFQARHGFARHQVDGAAQSIGAVGHRAETLGHLDGRQVGCGEAVEIDVAVIWHVDGNTVDVQGYLARVETADGHGFLVARIGRQRHARQQIEGVAHVVAVKAAHLGAAHLRARLLFHLACLLALANHRDRAQHERRRRLHVILAA